MLVLVVTAFVFLSRRLLIDVIAIPASCMRDKHCCLTREVCIFQSEKKKKRLCIRRALAELSHSRLTENL